jgi:hypothetical protein
MYDSKFKKFVVISVEVILITQTTDLNLIKIRKRCLGRISFGNIHNILNRCNTGKNYDDERSIYSEDTL